jgi:hypothetical protein
MHANAQLFCSLGPQDRENRQPLDRERDRKWILAILSFRFFNEEDDMAQTAIFGPFFATMFLTLVVWVYMYAKRISFISANKISPNDLAAPGQTRAALASGGLQSVGQSQEPVRNSGNVPRTRALSLH